MAVNTAPGPRGVGWAIRRVRRAQQRTLEDVAEAIGSDAGNLSRIEKGAQNAPESTYRAIATELGVPMSQLWLAAEAGDERLAAVFATLGRLSPENLEQLQRFANYLLTQQPPK